MSKFRKTFNIDPNNAYKCSNSCKRFQIIVSLIINVIKAISSHVRCPAPSKDPIWAEFRAKTHGKRAKLTILTQIMCFKCSNSPKRFQSTVFLIINVIKAISSHFRCPVPSKDPIWAEFRAEIHGKKQN